MSLNKQTGAPPVEKIRLIGDDDDVDIPVEVGEEDEEEGIGDNDDEDEVVGNSDDGNSVDEDDVDGNSDNGNSDDGIDITMDDAPVVPLRSTRSAPHSQALDIPVPPQFVGGINDTGDYSGDDMDVLSANENVMGDDEYDDDDDDEDPESYLQKFDIEMNRDLLLSHHPTQFNKNDSEISILCQLTRNTDNNVIDPLHKTIPFLTKYEKTRVLGQRAKQLNGGSKPYVLVPEHILDGYIIAQMEMKQKRIPFIIERPVHGGGCEYWRVRDLEIL
jgi:DNA-directed RNA polymerase subunit K/omega